MPLADVGFGHLETGDCHLLGDGEAGFFVNFLFLGEVKVFGGGVHAACEQGEVAEFVGVFE